MMMINDSRQKHPVSHTSERTFVPRTAIFVSAAIIRDREDELMEVRLCLCITKIGQRIILWYRLFFTSDQKIYNSFLEIFEIKINIFI